MDGWTDGQTDAAVPLKTYIVIANHKLELMATGYWLKI